LASNSLLETVVFAKRVVQRTVESPGTCAEPSGKVMPLSEATPHEAGSLTRDALQELMWRDVGIVRDGESLTRAKVALSAWAARAVDVGNRDDRELSDMLTCARLVTEAALAREESRGAHYRRDWPEPREEWRRRLVWRGV
jgi:L-aspartate oxidase